MPDMEGMFIAALLRDYPEADIGLHGNTFVNSVTRAQYDAFVWGWEAAISIIRERELRD